MRVLISGLPLFAQRLVNDLNNVNKNGNSYYFANTYYTLWGKVKFLLLLPFTDVVISFNGVYSQSGSMDWVLRLNKKLIMQWQGTDLLGALEAQKNNSVLRKYIDVAEHFRDCPWFENELNELNIKSTYVPFKHVAIPPAITNYKGVKILTYIAQNRQAFYGMRQVIGAALALPHIQFIIIGTATSEFNLPANVTLMGWQEQKVVDELMQECAVFLRITEHDGFSVSVTEALSKGMEVIWSYEFDCCYYAQTIDELTTQIKHCEQLIHARNYTPNQHNITYITQKFTKEVVINNYINKLTHIAYNK
jgi:hypothetical protein